MMKKFMLMIVVAAMVLPVQARFLYITRHGQSAFKEYFDQEINDYTLTPLGREQATLLGQYLKDVCKFNGTILASPFLRTVETAVIAASALDKKVILEPGLQEVNTGDNRHCISFQDIEKRFPGKTVAGKNLVPPWRVVNENPQIWARRYVRELDKILKENPGDLLLVTHAGGVGSLAPELFKRANLPMSGLALNCTLFVFELDENDRPVAGKYIDSYIPKEKITDNRGYLIPRK